MSNVLVDEKSLASIGDAIRTKLAVDEKFLPSDMADAILSIFNAKIGSFVPQRADYVSGHSIEVETDKYPRAVVVWRENETATVDQFSPFFFSCVCDETAPADNSMAYYGVRYKSSLSDGSVFFQQTGYVSTIYYRNNIAMNATSAYRAVTIDENKVYFKTFGDCRFREGVKYNYIIVFD